MKSKWNRDYTWRRVENKLRSIHRRAHKPEYKSRGYIAYMGTACLDLDNLDVYFSPLELTREDIDIAKAELKDQPALNDKRVVEITVTRISAKLSANPENSESRCSVACSPVVRGRSQETRTYRGTSTRCPDSNQRILTLPAKRKAAVRSVSTPVCCLLSFLSFVITRSLGSRKFSLQVEAANLDTPDYSNR